jgi:hypothetical protein
MNAAARSRKIKNAIAVEYRDMPATPERVARADGNIDVGDDRQGARIYTFKDTPMDRLYSRLKRDDKSDSERDLLFSEWRALQKYRNHWYFSGLNPSLQSIDLDRIFSSDPSNMTGMAKSERQAFHRQMWRKAVEIVGHKTSILLDNFVCYEWDRGVATSMSPYLFRKNIRDAARKLVRHWGI